MIVTVSGSSGLTKAYRSEESATGSLLISGASRCEDIGKPLSALDGFEQAGSELLVGQGRPRPAGEDVERALRGIPQRDHQRLAVVLRRGLAGQAQPGDTGDGRSDTRRGGDGEDPAPGQAAARPAAVTNATHARPFVMWCGVLGGLSASTPISTRAEPLWFNGFRVAAGENRQLRRTQGTRPPPEVPPPRSRDRASPCSGHPPE